MGERLHCAFERPALHRFAVHPDQSPLKVWDTHTGKLKVQTSDGTTERSVGLGWAAGLLWNAHRSGKLVLWSLAKNAATASLSLPVPAPFTAAVATDTDVFTATEGQGVARWSLASQSFVQEVCALKETVECIAVSRSGKSMLLASTSIRLYSLATVEAEEGKKKRKATDHNDAAGAGSTILLKAIAQHKFKGHTAAVRALVFAPTDETIFASAASSDRFIHVWRTTEASSAHATLTAPSPVHTLEFSSHHSSPLLHLLAITDSGIALVYHVPTAPRPASSKPITASTAVRIASGPEVLLTASFASASDLVLVRGTPVRPAFERAAYMSGGTAKAEVVLAPRESAAVQLGSDKRTGPIETLWVAEANKIAAPTDGTTPKKSRKAKSGDKEKDKEADTRTLAEKLEAAGLRINAEGAVADAKGAAPRADSVLHLLAQALHTRDAALLEVCLSQSDAGVVAATVSRLSTTHVLPLLAALVQRLQGRPARAAQLVTWLRALLVAHTAYLLSVPDLARSLSPLFQTLDARLSVFRKLLALSGRLDLLLSLRSTAKLASVAAPAVFDEREGGELSSEGEGDEEEDEGEGEEEEEEGEGEESGAEGGAKGGSGEESSGEVNGLDDGAAGKEDELMGEAEEEGGGDEEGAKEKDSNEEKDEEDEEEAASRHKQKRTRSSRSSKKKHQQ